MVKYKKVVDACELIINEIENGNIEFGYWNTGNVLANDVIVTILRNHVIELLRIENMRKTDKLINEIQNRPVMTTTADDIINVIQLQERLVKVNICLKEILISINNSWD